MHIPEPKQKKDGTWRIQLRIQGQSLVVTADTAKEAERLAYEYMFQKEKLQ